ncbi:hypothetical protein VN12_12335 [Pirellula sp. SH-Sr6A]|uniref:hypothetical protein n=1 Tax=Pirellula sp. SH-Sr6A TaxID=1632865 RepID=UPI00078B470E|nr:hypothetical protein [Pirellula sp. SH-Sr6A]AMV32907.1 hypothetical protein VN12_12335 [Pirellula sp. SH-Sr6A]
MKRFCVLCIGFSLFALGCGAQDASIPSDYSKSTLPAAPPSMSSGGGPESGGGDAPAAGAAPPPKLDL